MAHEFEIKHFDTRTMDRYIARGELSTKERDRYIQALPDVADKGEKVYTIQPDIEELMD